MNSIADGSVIIQTFSQSVPSTPPGSAKSPCLLSTFASRISFPPSVNACALPAAASATTM